MPQIVKLGILAALAVGAGLVIAGRPGERSDRGSARGAATASVTRKVPRLIDLGANKCIPCKAMAPTLEQLRADYAGRLEVAFIDVWKNPEQAEPYRIQMIPTQIFYAADWRELARHQGFMSREEILAQWKAVGVEL